MSGSSSGSSRRVSGHGTDGGMSNPVPSKTPGAPVEQCNMQAGPLPMQRTIIDVIGCLLNWAMPSSVTGHSLSQYDRGRWACVIGLSIVALILLMLGNDDRRLHMLFGSLMRPSARAMAPNDAARPEDKAIHASNYALPVKPSKYFGLAAAGAAGEAAAATAGPDPGIASSIVDEGRETCQGKCCWSLAPAGFAHPGVAPGAVTRKKLTHEDFLSPVNNKRMADVALGGLPKPEGYTYAPNLSDDLLPCLQNGTAIWVDTPSLHEFVQNWLPRIHINFVLLSGDSDEQAPGRNAHLLQDPRLMHWLAMNCDHHATPGGKLTCLPLGVSQWWSYDERKDKFLQTMATALSPSHLTQLPPEKLAQRQHPKPAAQRSVLVGFYIPNNVGERVPAMQQFCGHEGQGPRSDLAPLATCFKTHDGGLTLLDRYDVIAEHRFVLSPPGVGPDCYRTWEALLLGSYPIVKSSPLNSEYENLPVLVVDRWDQITPELLETKYNEFSQRKDYMWGKLYLRYYQRVVTRHRMAAGHSDRWKRIKYVVRDTGGSG